MIPVLGALPAALRTVAPTALADVCDELTVFRLGPEGRRPVVLSLMLHGNEPAGLFALQHLLGELEVDPTKTPHPLVVVVGNVRAAAAGVRRLPEQADYNRIWSGELGRPAQVLKELARDPPLCILDLHNSSGQNPLFVGVTELDRTTMGLAQAFSPNVVNILGPTGMLVQEASSIAPSLTLECGAPDNPQGFRTAALLVAELLHCDALPALGPDVPSSVLENMATIKLSPATAHGRDLAMLATLEDLNFKDAPPGTPLAQQSAPGVHLQAFDNDGRDVTDEFLRVEGGDPSADSPKLVTTSAAFVPVMFTLDPRVMVQDCVGYAMKRRRVVPH